MNTRVAFLCFDCVAYYREIPSIRCEEATGQILHAECEHCRKMRFGKLYEIFSGSKKKQISNEPCP